MAIEKFKLVAKKASRHELTRLLPMLAFAFLLLYADVGKGVILRDLGIIAAVLALSHVSRRILLPYLELEKYADKALENPIGSAIVFASVIYTLTIVFQATISLIR